MVAAIGRKIAGKLLKPKSKVIPMSEVSKRMTDRKPTANKGTKPNADAAGKAFLKNKPPAGSGDQGKQRVLPKGNKGTRKLQQQFEALTKSAQRAEVAKGANSKYASVLRKLGKLKDGKKAGGKVMYRKEGKKVGSPLTGNQKKLDVDNDGKITKKDFDTINAKPKSKPTPPSDGGATGRANRTSKMEAGSLVTMNKKMGGGKVMKYKKGGIVYMKNGGVVKASKDGDDLVSSCYD